MTKKQIERQDFVDNAIHNLLDQLAPEKYGRWDIEAISSVRETIQDALRLSEKERYTFYPWIK